MNESLPSDAYLIEKSQSGDRSAFDTLVRKHERRAYQYAYRLTASGEEAADIVSEAFVRVYKAIHNFKSQSAFTTWLYRILTNCYLDHRKKDKAKITVSLEVPVGVGGGDLERQIEDLSDGPSQVAERSERERLIHEALQRLPEYQRAMLMLYHGELQSYEQISQALDLPIGTVKSRLNRARLSLRQLLIGDEELFLLD